MTLPVGAVAVVVRGEPDTTPVKLSDATRVGVPIDAPFSVTSAAL